MPSIRGAVRHVRDFLSKEIAATLNDEGKLLRKDRSLVPSLFTAKGTEIESARGRIKVAVGRVGHELSHGTARVREAVVQAGKIDALLLAPFPDHASH